MTFFIEPNEPPKMAVSTHEFIALMALLMALTALSIDIMLPALPKIGLSLGIDNENERQFILSTYLIGFAFGQLLFGPVSDSYGRKKPLLFGIVIYCIATFFASISHSLTTLLIARFIQGFGAASPRVIAQAIVRDQFGGRDMARVLSFIMMVFIVVPVLAPSIGEGIIWIFYWRVIFFLLFSIAVIAGVWAALRLPETKLEAEKIPLSIVSVLEAAKIVMTNRRTLGYIVSSGFIFGLLLSYITSAQQIFIEVYGLGSYFPIVFGSLAFFMVAASLVNALIVQRIGMRAVSYYALYVMFGSSCVIAFLGFPAHLPLIVFCVYMAVVFFCFGLIMPNFGSLAMEPMGQVSGTASSILGFYTTAVGATLGSIIGQLFDGTVRPLLIGITALCGFAIITLLFTTKFKIKDLLVLEPDSSLVR